MKMHADPLKLDEQFRKLHEELFSGYDCSQCRNCCKMYCGMIPQEDIEKAAGQFSMSGKDFVERFLEYDLGEMSYKTKHCPCDFLKDDGACALGDCKPINCRRYPYTDQISLHKKKAGLSERPLSLRIWIEIQEMLWKEKMTTLGTGNAFMASAITLVI